MPDALNPDALVEINGREYRLRMTLKAARLFKEKTGIDAFRDGIDLLQMDVDQIQAIVWCCLLHENPDMKYEDVENIIDRNNWLRVLTAIGKAMSLGFPAAGEGEAKKSAFPLSVKKQTG